MPVLIMLFIALAFPLGLILATTFLGPKVKHAAKDEAYECGVPTQSSAQERFPVKFYRVAILFLLFDVEAAFLFPWAVYFKQGAKEWGKLFMLSEFALFLVILVIGYLYAWKRGALEWD
jgi:NADH-quinone oxidoreductase subunit A